MTREEAIKEIQDASDYEVRHGDIEHHHEDIMRRVEAFEQAVNALQKEPEWIPVSERLPEEHVCFEDGIMMDFVREQPTVKAISLDRIKEARALMEQTVFDTLADDGSDWYTAEKVSECLQIIDKLIAEVEGTE